MTTGVKKQRTAAPLTMPAAGHAQPMQLLVGRRPIQLPSQRCEAENVRRAVERINPPFVVIQGKDAERISIRRRVFFEAEGVRVECENDGELGLACKLVAESHSQWHEGDEARETQACIEETRRMEQAAEEGAQASDGGEGDAEALSEEDISIEEWGQMGYKWFRREDVTYI